MNRKVEPRNPVTMMLISVFTCMIGALYWIYALVNDICALEEKQETGGIDMLLCIVTCGFYTVYLNYRMGNDIDRIKQDRGIDSKNTGILCLLLAVFSFGIVSYFILQKEINELC